MREISATLAAAAEGRQRRPEVWLEVHDATVRWAIHATGAASLRRTAMVAVPGGLVVRALLQAGSIYAARISSPHLPHAWPGAWATVVEDADGDEDLALAAYSAQHLSLFYRNQAGELARVDSADGGASWSAASAVRACTGRPTRVAATGGVCAWSEGSQVRLAITRDDLGQPAWTAEQVYAGAPAFATCRGLALARDASLPGRYYLASALDGALYTTTYDAATQTWGVTHQRVPGGTAGAATDRQVAEPAAVHTAAGLTVTYIDRPAPGDQALWEELLVWQAAHFPYGRPVAALPLGQPAAARVALADCDGTLYGASENQVFRASPGPPALTALRPERYTLRAPGSLLRVWLPNATGAGGRGPYDDYGQAGEPSAPLRPGATVTLHRGYGTAEGPETAALAPHTIEAVALRRGPTGSTLELTTVDGWGLLARARPLDACAWRGSTIRTLLAEVCGLAGLGYVDEGETALGRIIAWFTTGPQATAADAARALLALAGAVARCDAAGRLRACPYEALPGEPLTLGTLLAVSERRAWPLAHTSRVYGEGVAWAAPAGAATMADGWLAVRQVVDHRATDADLAAALAESLAREARRGTRRIDARVPLRPELEVWDAVRLPAWPAGEEARVVALEERYDAAQAHYDTRVIADVEQG